MKVVVKLLILSAIIPSIVISGLREIGSCSTPGLAREVFVSGNYAYIADWSGGLRVIDVSDPTNPSEVGYYSSPEFYAVDLSVSGSYAYVSYYNHNTGQGGLKVINISNPSAPNPVGDVILVNQGDTRGVYGEGGYVYVTYTLSSSMSGGVKVVDISNPSNPQVIGDIELNPGPSYAIYVRGNYAYVGYINPANNGKGLCILDVSNPSNPVIVSRYSVSSSGGVCTVMDVDVEGNYVYFAPCDRGIDIIDVSNPSSPRGVSNYGSRCKAVDVEGDYAYVGEDYDLKVLNVSNVNNPTLEDQVTLPSVIQGIDVSGNYIYVADYLHGLKIFEYSTLVFENNDLGPNRFSLIVNSSGLEIQFNASDYGNLEVFIFDLAGRIVYKKTLYVNKGINKVHLRELHLNSGVYLVGIKRGSENLIKKMIMVR